MQVKDYNDIEEMIQKLAIIIARTADITIKDLLQEAVDNLEDALEEEDDDDDLDMGDDEDDEDE